MKLCNTLMKSAQELILVDTRSLLKWEDPRCSRAVKNLRIVSLLSLTLVVGCGQIGEVTTISTKLKQGSITQQTQQDVVDTPTVGRDGDSGGSSSGDTPAVGGGSSSGGDTPAVGGGSSSGGDTPAVGGGSSSGGDTPAVGGGSGSGSGDTPAVGGGSSGGDTPAVGGGSSGGDTPAVGGGDKPAPTYRAESTSVEVRGVSKVDILVVVDNSGSMSVEQANMAHRFNTFVDRLNGLDWQLAVTTTDLDSRQFFGGGQLIPFYGMTGTKILTSKMNLDQVKASFAKTIQRPEKGSGSEQGIAATYMALERSLLANSSGDTANGDLIRPDASLAVIVVTDADETPYHDYNGNSLPTFRNSPENLLSFIQKGWLQSKNFIFHSLVVPDQDEACLKKDGNEAYGLSYIRLSKLTNGIVGSVCASDYGSQLSIMGNKVRDLVKTIRLSCSPADVNKDGKPDLVFTTAPGQRLSNHRLEGMDVVFEEQLPEGKTSVEYHCEVAGELISQVTSRK